MTEAEVRDDLYQAGFRGNGLETMLAIAKAESGLNPSSIYSTAKEYSVGLFQFNLKAHPGITATEAADPKTAASLAYEMSHHGNDFSAWSTYTTDDPNKSYKRFLGTPSGTAMNLYSSANFPSASYRSKPLPAGFDSWLTLVVAGVLAIIALGLIRKGR